MGFITNDEIVGYRVDGEIVCAQNGCMTTEEMAVLFAEENIICRREVEEADGFYFCDRCEIKI